MGNEDSGYTTRFIKVPLKVWMKVDIGDSYTTTPYGLTIPLKGKIIGKNPGELVVRFKLPRNCVG